ncbi:MAG: hypothetical protein AAF197_01270, partial [Pseudomonadota bacterium]
MLFIEGIERLANNHRPSVVSIGNFDGVHLGHQAVVKTLLDEAHSRSLPATIVTFEPLAKEYFKPNSIARLTTITEKVALLKSLGVEQVLCIEFNDELVNTQPQAFIENVLLQGLGVKFLSVGDDFRFGHERAGDFKMLERYGQQHSFDVVSHDTFTLAGERVSSGRIRTSLKEGRLDLAAELLGRPFSI